MVKNKRIKSILFALLLVVGQIFGLWLGDYIYYKQYGHSIYQGVSK